MGGLSKVSPRIFLQHARREGWEALVRYPLDFSNKVKLVPIFLQRGMGGFGGVGRRDFSSI